MLYVLLEYENGHDLSRAVTMEGPDGLDLEAIGSVWMKPYGFTERPQWSPETYRESERLDDEWCRHYNENQGAWWKALHDDLGDECPFAVYLERNHGCKRVPSVEHCI